MNDLVKGRLVANKVIVVCFPSNDICILFIVLGFAFNAVYLILSGIKTLHYYNNFLSFL